MGGVKAFCEERGAGTEQAPSSCVGVMGRGHATLSLTPKRGEVVSGRLLHERLLGFGEMSPPMPAHTHPSQEEVSGSPLAA